MGDDLSAVQADVAALAQKVPRELDDVVERLRQLTTVQKYSPEELKKLAAVIEGAVPLVKEGKAPSEAVEEAFKVRQHFWSTDNVYNAQNIVQLMVSNAGSAAPEAPQDRQAPLVLVVMNQDDVRELCDGTAFAEYPPALQKDFAQLEALLQAEAVDWQERYGSAAAEWRPFGSDSTIEQLVSGTFEQVNRSAAFDTPLVPYLFDIDELNADRQYLRQLRRDGCLVVIDSVSMRHPRLQRAFHHSLLDAYPNTSVVVIAPVDQAFEAARQLAVVLQLRLDDLEFARRRTDLDEEMGASMETANQQLFEQWVAAQVRRLAGSFGIRMGIRQHIRFSG